MADAFWNAPGSDKAKVIYRVVQYASGEWAIEKSEVTCIAWFPDRQRAIAVAKALLPIDAERQL